MMKEKIRQDELLTEAPETRWSSSAVEEQTTAYMDDWQIELRDLIARRAYEIYEERGMYDGGDVDDWLKAEAEVKSSFTAKMRRPVTSRAGAGL